MRGERAACTDRTSCVETASAGPHAVGAAGNYFSTPVTTTPRMNARWARKKRSPGPPWSSAPRPGSVGLGDVERVELLDGNRERLQIRLERQVQQGNEEIVPGEEEVEQRHRHDRGYACGRITDRRILNGPAPSIMAASSRSRGMLMKNWRSRNTLNALANRCGTISGSHVPIQPSRVKMA